MHSTLSDKIYTEFSILLAVLWFQDLWYDWKVATIEKRAEWRCFLMESGAASVIMAGMMSMLPLSADSSDSRTEPFASV